MIENTIRFTAVDAAQDIYTDHHTTEKGGETDR